MTAVDKCINQVLRSEAKRHKRFASDRSVYAYRAKGSDIISDNLLLLPKESEVAHRDYLRSLLADLGADRLAMFKNYSLVRIGHFNVCSLAFKHCSEKVVVSIEEVIKDLGKVAKK